MAAQAIERARAPVTLSSTIPMPAVARILSRYDRPQLAAFISVAIDLLDALDDDPDAPDFSSRSDGLPGDPGDHEPTGDDESGAYVEWITKPHHGDHELAANGAQFGSHEDDELSGDEEDGCFAEDEPAARLSRMRRGPGCIISDADSAVDDRGCDEDSDAEEEEPVFPSYGIDQTQPAEPWALAVDRSIMHPHRDRIRRTRCDRDRWGWTLREVDSEPREDA